MQGDTGPDQACQRLLQLHGVTEENSKKTKVLKEQIEHTKQAVLEYMQAHNVKCLPIGNSRYAVVKEKVSLPALNDEFLRAVFRSFFHVKKGTTVTDEDVQSFMDYLSEARKKLSTSSTFLEVSKSKPLDVLLG